MKKGTFSTLAGIVMVLMVGLSLASISYAGIKRVNRDSDRNLCHVTAMTQAISQWPIDVAGIPIASPSLGVSSECKTHYVTFFNDKITERVDDKKRNIEIYDSRTGKTGKSFKELTPNIVNDVIAEQIYWCWWQFNFNNGTIPPFIHRSQLWDDGIDIQCFRCAHISFDTSVDYPPENEEANFFDYFQNTLKTNELTYYNLTSLYNGPCTKHHNEDLNCYDALWEYNSVNLNVNIDDSKRYVVLYVREGYDKNKFTTATYIVPDGDVARICNAKDNEVVI